MAEPTVADVKNLLEKTKGVILYERRNGDWGHYCYGDIDWKLIFALNAFFTSRLAVGFAEDQHTNKIKEWDDLPFESL